MPKRTCFPNDLNNFVNSHTECCARETAMPYPGTIITDLASMSVLTVSSLVKIVGSRSSTGAFGSFFALPPVSPNPPANTETNDRFIASAMTKDKMIPDAPTKAPPIIINSLSNMKPAKTPAHPDPEFNTDMTTGISAPPIAMVNKYPYTAERPVMTYKQIKPPEPEVASKPPIAAITPVATIPPNKQGNQTTLPGGIIGFVEIFPANFKQATMEPMNVTTPTTMPKR
mmetsp:Transcript_218/g.743  ORF Transcript_218/g.743 Transcript_218/m.743 type:complete len:228 (-) Transcript_218:464-1147(-)